ncbi:MAG: helix-turn-helix domain-containing protein [Victivallaceae bacterium]|nr:helix-turn-helix domain-containing protein [Victivallaceae bacterium]
MKKLFLTNYEYISNSDLPVNLLRRSPQPDYPLHSHEFSELVIVYAGHGVQITADGDYEVSCGDVFVVDCMMSHGYRDTAGLKLVNIIFDLKNLESPLSDLPLFPSFHLLFSLSGKLKPTSSPRVGLRLNDAQIETVMAVVDAMETELLDKPVGYRMMLTAQFMQLATLLIRCYEHQPQSEQNSQVTGLAAVLGYINRNYRKKITLKELASFANMSESSLNRMFHLAVKESPINYCNQLRIHKAIILLLNTELSVSEIATTTGFEDSNYFSRSFRQIIGESPRQYRMNNCPAE